MRRLKILVSAYACEPDKGSEPGVGWNWVKQIARFHEVWVITRANNRASIERELHKTPINNLRFVYYDVQKVLSFWKKGTSGVHFYYFLWQIGVVCLAKRLVATERIDVVHHITFGSIFLPTFLPLLSVPFVWGPIGGAEQAPKAFKKEWAARPRFKEWLRFVLIKTLCVNPFFLVTCRRATLIITKTEDTAFHIPRAYRSKIIVTTDVAVFPDSLVGPGEKEGVVHILSVGSLDAWRGFDLAIRAVAQAAEKYVSLELVIIGAGAEEVRLKRLTHDLGLDHKVSFMGKLEWQGYSEQMLKSDIVLNPCLKEGGVTVLFDALLHGKPVICLDVAGSSRIINEESGIRIKPTTPEETAEDIGNALVRLAADQPLRARMGVAGRKLVLNYHSWEKKGEFIRELYSGLTLKEA